MVKANPPLPLGYSPVPRGYLVNAVTCLDMTESPATRPARGFVPPYRLEAMDRANIGAYRALYSRVGEPWLWVSRQVMADEDLSAILADPRVDVYGLGDGGDKIGILELDFRKAGECELAFFGVAPHATGKGLGRALMDTAIRLAWERPIRRFWVHTCTFDHPRALDFYLRSGFRPYAFEVEVLADPRLSGHLPRSAAPHVPLLDER